MLKNRITKKEVKKIMEIPGKARGAAFRDMAKYIRGKRGDEELKRLEKEMENLGYPFDFSKAKKMEWYPIGLGALSYTILERVLNWDDKKFIDLGDNVPKLSFTAKLFMRFFRSPRAVFGLAPKYWRKRYTIGSMESAEWNEKEKYAVLRLKDFKVHPAHCTILLGFLRRMAQLGGAKNITVEENKCMFKGDPYHEFIVRWR